MGQFKEHWSLGIPYSGSNMLSSNICMDKNISKKILRYEGVETPDWIELTKWRI